MSHIKSNVVSSMLVRFSAGALLASLPLFCATAGAQAKKAAPPKAAPPKTSSPAAKSSTPSAGGHTNTGATSNHATGGGGGAASKGTPGTTRTAGGGTKTVTSSGKEVTKSPSGHVTAVKTANGHEAKFDSKGNVKEVHANGMTVRRGPNGMRRTEVERGDHSRVVAYGHGHGYVEHRYEYGGHPYYARGYYYHGGYYRGYYSGYYYGGGYYYGYRPAYFYPPVYYGWAANPWAAPVSYGWGWGGAPWYGYYGAYFAPYPVYPSAAFWIADYMIAASLTEAYAAAAASNAADLHTITPPHLIYASYDPSTGTTSPTMSKEVKDAVADEIKLELAAAQKNGDAADGNSGSLKTLLADGKPHVFVAGADLTVTSSGQDCAITEGDVLALNTPPAGEVTSADLRMLASKQTDCAKGNVVSVEMKDLQDMYNHLLTNIDHGMTEMKDHPGKGGLPAPPAEAISGTKQAPYAAAAPAADPGDAADVDKTAAEGAQTEKEVVAEATAPDGSDAAAPSSSPIGGMAPSAPAASAPPKGPITLAMGNTPDQVITAKGQPLNKIVFPSKTVYVYSDVKITFKNGKLTDIE